MPLVQTRGAASAQGFGEFAQATAANYIEDVFSTYLYTGTGAALTITNNIDLSTKGGLTWIKGRSGATGHRLTDTARGVTKSLASETTAAEATETTGLTAFGTTGFTIGADADYNTSAATYASWTFREQPKFFDVLTYTGTGSAGRTVAHSLGSAPGAIIVKKTSGADAWAVYHRGVNGGTGNGLLVLNTTAAQNVNGRFWWGDNTNFIAPTSTNFTVSNDGQVNASGETYVAYLFAHDAGGFGLTGTDNVISCGSFTLSAGNVTVSLGYEPQFLMVKRTNGAGDWTIADTMRGLPVPTADINGLYPSLANAESASATPRPTATGFQAFSGDYGTGNNNTYIYIAIRRGPMKVPTLGTSVFAPVARAGTGATGSSTSFGQVTDLTVIKQRSSTQTWAWTDRLRGATQELTSAATTVETAFANDVTGFATMTGFTFGTGASGQVNTSAATYSDLLFKRAPGFFDEVCYTGTGSNTTITHNLGAVPELIIVKGRSGATAWDSYSSALANTEYVVVNTTAAKATGATRWNSTTPTSSVFSVGTSTTTNASAGTYVAYLFATCAGVSKVGSYTGTGTTLQIDCGFTGGARFVLIKRTDSTGDWYVWDSARGIVAGNDPYLLLNSTAAEVTNTDYVDTYSAGFEISSTAPAAINASAGTFVFLAVA